MSFYSSNGKYSRSGASGRAAGGHRKRTKSKKFLILNLLIIILVLFGLCAGGYALAQTLQLHRENAEMEDLSDMVLQAETTVPAEEKIPEDTVPAALEETRDTAEPEHKKIMSKYQELYKMNPDMIGWLSIEGTGIDYPVMHSPEEPERYLHTNFNGEHNFSGTPFLDGKSTIDSDQLLIYGHNMNNGTMFHDLIKYRTKDFWKDNPVILFDTLYDEYEFEIMAVLYERVYLKTENCFKFYQFIDAENEEEFNEAVSYYKEHSAYDTGVTAEYGDQLLALVTCHYHVDNGRFVVIARRTDK